MALCEHQAVIDDMVSELYKKMASGGVTWAMERPLTSTTEAKLCDLRSTVQKIRRLNHDVIPTLVFVVSQTAT